jgi:hypothetical protein
VLYQLRTACCFLNLQRPSSCIEFCASCSISLQAYEARVAARQRNVDFYQRSLMQQQQQGAAFPAALPESLKPKPGNPAQQRVYEDYGRLPRGVHPLPRGYAEGGQPPSSPLQVCVFGA